MKLASKENGLVIKAETHIEKAFVRDTLGLKNVGDEVVFVLNNNGFLETLPINGEAHFCSGVSQDTCETEGA